MRIRWDSVKAIVYIESELYSNSYFYGVGWYQLGFNLTSKRTGRSFLKKEYATYNLNCSKK